MIDSASGRSATMSAMGQSPAGDEHPGGFGKDGRLVGGQVDDPVGDHGVVAGVGHGQVFDAPFEETDVADAPGRA